MDVDGDAESLGGGESQFDQPSSSESVVAGAALFWLNCFGVESSTTMELFALGVKLCAVGDVTGETPARAPARGPRSVGDFFRSAIEARFGALWPLFLLPVRAGGVLNVASKCLDLPAVSASSPTVAWRRSSKKLNRPSFKSPTNCLPVCTRSSFVAPGCCVPSWGCRAIGVVDMRGIAVFGISLFLLLSTCSLIGAGMFSRFARLAGLKRLNVRVCLPPSNTVLCGCLVLIDMVRSLVPPPASLCGLGCNGNVASFDGLFSGLSGSTCRISFLFFVASCIAHCFFSFPKSISAFSSSSLSSSTRRSCAASAVRKSFASGVAGLADAGVEDGTSDSGDVITVELRISLMSLLVCRGTGTENRFMLRGCV